MSQEKSTQTFVERVKAFFEGGDDRKIARFQSKAVQTWQDNIDLAKREVKESKEKIEDHREALAEASINVDLERIKSVDTLDSYIASYTSRLGEIQAKIRAEEAKQKSAEERIAQFESLIALVK